VRKSARRHGLALWGATLEPGPAEVFRPGSRHIKALLRLDTTRSNRHRKTLSGYDAMLIIREIMYCRPGKIRPLIEKYRAMASYGEDKGWGRMRVMTDVSGERYWTLVVEIEVESFEDFMKMGENEDDARVLGEIMSGYHDLVESGRREIFTVEI